MRSDLCLGNATIEINGGTFKAVTPANTLNCKDGSNAKITVKGGSFYKYDPSNRRLRRQVMKLLQATM